MDILCSRNYAIFGVLLICGTGLVFWPMVWASASWNIIIGFGVLSFLICAVFVVCYLSIRKDENKRGA